MAGDVTELLCPNCATRPQETADGFCRRCSGDRAAEKYAARQQDVVAARRRAWAASSGAAAVRERQRFHRLEKDVTPRERPAPGSDPWVLAQEALQRLARVRQSLGAKWQMQMAAMEQLDEACELIKQLAVGPD